MEGVVEGFRNSLWIPLSPSPSPLSLRDPLPLLLGRGQNQPTSGGRPVQGGGEQLGLQFQGETSGEVVMLREGGREMQRCPERER